MYILFDTCFILHSHELFKKKVLDLRPILKLWNIATTHDVVKELKYYSMEKFIPVNEMTIVSLSSETKREFQKKYEYLQNFDKADQSLWMCSIDTEHIVLTDDGELYEELRQMHVQTFRLPGFIIFLYKLGHLSKIISIKCFKYWEKNGRYKKSYIKKWRSEIEKI